VQNIENLSENEYLEQFDLITCHNVLGYVKEPLREIIKLSKWLKDDGIFSIVMRNSTSRVIESYVRDKNIEFAERRMNEPYFKDNNLGVCKMYSDKQIKGWMDEAELSIEAVYGLSTLFDITPDSYNGDEEWKSKALELELKLSEISPYREIATYWHFVVKKLPKY
jgi:S-adenosylmethionine-dependent methyltransferase